MKKVKYLLIVFICLCLTSACEAKRSSASAENSQAYAVANSEAKQSSSPSDSKIIYPGLSVGLLKIDDTRDDALSKLGSKRFWEFKYTKKQLVCEKK